MTLHELTHINLSEIKKGLIFDSYWHESYQQVTLWLALADCIQSLPSLAPWVYWKSDWVDHGSYKAESKYIWIISIRVRGWLSIWIISTRIISNFHVILFIVNHIKHIQNLMSISAKNITFQCHLEMLTIIWLSILMTLSFVDRNTNPCWYHYFGYECTAPKSYSDTDK